MQTDPARHQAHPSPFAVRRAGILLHPTSLPLDHGGGLGRDAYRFVDFLADSGLSIWQTLPLGPTHDDLSPYQCLSVFAGDASLVNLERLVEKGWLQGVPASVRGRAGWESKRPYLQQALAGFEAGAGFEDLRAFDRFREEQGDWLEDYVLYRALRLDFGRSSWLDWPAQLRDREPQALEQARARLQENIDLLRFEQFVFLEQWMALKRYANEKNILLFGDLPIFVAHDSAEVWAHRDYFTLDGEGRAETVAGVPPDYFSETGQRWGNPHYRWTAMEEDDFAWWRRRIQHQLAIFDIIRIDHFRGFEAYWEIPADAETAVNGHWVKAPGDRLFKTLTQEFDPLPLVAEDLGLITPEVEELRHRYRLPGMKVLQFAFEGDATNPYLPHNCERDYVIYTGTHDNDTTVGWYNGLREEVRQRMLEYLGYPQEPIPWPLIRAAYASICQLAVVPLQDVLMLGDEHRMNVPGTTEGNWQWRFEWEQIPADLPHRLRALARLYRRLPEPERT